MLLYISKVILHNFYKKRRHEYSINELAQIIIFKLGNELYGLQIEQVQEVVPLTPISELPNSPPHIQKV